MSTRVMSTPSRSIPSAGARIEALVQSRLRATPYPSIQRLNCDFANGQLFLHGRVPSFFEKQVAQEALADLEGIDQIVNGVEVA